MVKVAALGLDAAELTFVEQLLARGELPHLAELRARALECRLDNVVTYRSELPWTQFATGRRAAELDYWGTVAFDPASYRAVVAGALDAAPFWARADVRSLVFDVPHTVLRDDVPGMQVTAWGAHSPEYPRASLPSGLLTEVDDRFGPHPAFANDSDPGWYSSEYLDNLVAALRAGAHRRVDILEWLLERDPSVDLVLATMSEPHSGGHHLWHGVDPQHPLAGSSGADRAATRVVDLYRALDECVGRFVALAGPDATVVVFALHGMQSNGNDLPSLVLLPELLHRHRFGRAALHGPDPATWRAAGMPPVVPDHDDPWIGYMASRFADGPADRVRNLAKRVLPPALLAKVRAAVGREARPLGPLSTPIPGEDSRDVADLKLGARDPDYQIVWRYRRHWPVMRAFALPSFSDGHVRVNVRGRERDGVVAPDDFRAACDEVIDLVAACRDPRSGEPVLADAVRLRDDPQDPGPPADVVLMWAGTPDAFEHPTLRTIGPFPYCRTGEHSPTGFSFIAGPGIERGDLGRRPADDLAPTILALLGRSPDRELAGTSFPVGVPFPVPTAAGGIDR
jgi:predicted AlkP superfamily phosphohydrolase/phosphomutase